MIKKISKEDLKSVLPDVTNTLKLLGLQKPVEVYRDRWGIPHIRAENENDLFFAQGFVTSQDRFWHMDFDRCRALGHWAELIGSDGIEQDQLLRTAGMGRTAKLDYEVSSVEAKGMIDAYTAGVNCFLDTSMKLPIEYHILDCKPNCWENWHCLTVYKMRNTLLGTFEPKLFRTRLVNAIGPERVAELIKGTPKGHLLTVPPGAVFEGTPLDGVEGLSLGVKESSWLGGNDAGSNGWSISGDLTESGLPLIAGDSHRELDTPNVYYQIHLSCPDFSVIGYSVPGMPGVLHFCHNDYVAWGMTYGGADTQDLFIEKFRENSEGREYEFRGNWLPAKVLNENIKVKGGASIKFQITLTRHGPVIAGDPSSGLGVTISDPGLIEGSAWPDAVRNAMRSKSVDELHIAFQNWTDRVNNYVVGDIHGNFGYLHEGKIPIRNESNGWRAVPGWTGEYDWKGYIPWEELPKAINPKNGYVVTCNQRVVGHNYRYFLGLDFAPEFRAKRIQGRIMEREQGSATVSNMAQIHADYISIPAQILTEALDNVVPLDEDSSRALSLLRGWNGEMDRDQPYPLIYAKTKSNVIRMLLNFLFDDLSEDIVSGVPGSSALVRQLAMNISIAIEENDPKMLPDDLQWADLLGLALKDAIFDLKKILGDNIEKWKWGDLHRTQPKHPLSEYFPDLAEFLDPPSIPMHGDGDTPLAGSYGLQNEFFVNSLSVNRYIHNTSDWTKSVWIVPLGSSGHPGSPHYFDQLELWANLEFIPQLWDWNQITLEAKTKQRLTP